MKIPSSIRNLSDWEALGSSVAAFEGVLDYFGSFSSPEEMTTEDFTRLHALLDLTVEDLKTQIVVLDAGFFCQGKEIECRDPQTIWKGLQHDWEFEERMSQRDQRIQERVSQVVLDAIGEFRDPEVAEIGGRLRTENEKVVQPGNGEDSA